MSKSELALRRKIINYFRTFPEVSIRSRDLATMVLGQDLEVVRMVQRLVVTGQLEYAPNLRVRLAKQCLK